MLYDRTDTLCGKTTQSRNFKTGLWDALFIRFVNRYDTTVCVWTMANTNLYRSFNFRLDWLACGWIGHFVLVDRFMNTAVNWWLLLVWEMENYHLEFLNCPIFARSWQVSIVRRNMCANCCCLWPGRVLFPVGPKSFRTPVNLQDRGSWSRATIDLSWQAACPAIVSCILNKSDRKRWH